MEMFTFIRRIVVCRTSISPTWKQHNVVQCRQGIHHPSCEHVTGRLHFLSEKKKQACGFMLNDYNKGRPKTGMENEAETTIIYTLLYGSATRCSGWLHSSFINLPGQHSPHVYEILYRQLYGKFALVGMKTLCLYYL